ncbi:camphor resistance protein CrcB [Rhodothalassium salexigens DSM 2132]|uniref:Fluoride-specific ion channel FluC n=1 Tax=Rhodothalassium salexigens DSM 2132 TaxID=1188247 RepID=A0A4V2SNP2_RHOSA|nr:fluoride efflux transporter CrcB [Rhodothalassium salexigens]MBB4212363.1 CrcB protein [Rhodothalassium salexigens DSM 2132]MBK1637787.1 hypothetical protein [Rhodothalassium salexigens DSM 2132]TCP32006.1 camphor resistance protein CrcB [Rhodothalassium salexigens DSM 2132]
MAGVPPVLAIALGGALGAVSRHYVSATVMRWWGQTGGGAFPLGTLAVNVAGSALMGLLVGLLVGRFDAGVALRSFLTVGFLGGFTTFSTFSLETMLLIEKNQWALAGAYALLSVGLCVAAAFAGLALARGVGAGL